MIVASNQPGIIKVKGTTVVITAKLGPVSKDKTIQGQLGKYWNGLRDNSYNKVAEFIETQRAAYPDEWVLIVDCERDESRKVVRGRVAAHSARRSDVYKQIPRHTGGAIRYFGEVPADVCYML